MLIGFAITKRRTQCVQLDLAWCVSALLSTHCSWKSLRAFCSLPGRLFLNYLIVYVPCQTNVRSISSLVPLDLPCLMLSVLIMGSSLSVHKWAQFNPRYKLVLALYILLFGLSQYHSRTKRLYDREGQGRDFSNLYSCWGRFKFNYLFDGEPLWLFISVLGSWSQDAPWLLLNYLLSQILLLQLPSKVPGCGFCF